MKVHVDTKKKHLIQFHTHLKTPGWNLIGCMSGILSKMFYNFVILFVVLILLTDGNKKDEVDLLENFNRVINCFLKIEPEYQKIITDTCEKMGTGMAEFLERDVGTIQDLDDYCHYVAGIVGHGLSGLWIASGVGHFPNLLRDNDQTVPCQELLRLSNSVGLFLQKVNIIRDIVEDISETTPPRIFWPKDIWSKYVNRIEDLVAYKPIGCLNELITNSVRHVQDCLDYLKHFRSLTIPSETTVFSFVAVGTLMSMATLELCFNNDKVFQGTVKISHDETLRIMANADTYSTTLRLVIHYSERLLVKADLNIKENPEDSDSKFMQGVITELIRRCNKDMGEIDY